MKEALRQELVDMAAADQVAAWALYEATRDDPVIKGQFVFLFPRHQLPVEYDTCETLNRAHGNRLAEVVEEHGWPGHRAVGEDGAAAAWLILQHLDVDNELRKRLLPRLETAVGAGDADPQHLAAATDRVLLVEGHLQRYGTHLCLVDGAHAPVVGIENPDGLDARRAAIGLGTWDMYVEECRAN